MKVSKNAWQQARADWEATSERSLAEVARELDVAVPTVHARARREGWVKLFEPQTVAAAAHLRADQAERDMERQQDAFQLVVAEALDLSIAGRVNIISRQRQDWTEHRALYPAERMAAEPQLARRAKAHAEMLAIRQRGEAIAWGLVSFSGQTTDAPLVEDAQQAGARPDASTSYLVAQMRRFGLLGPDENATDVEAKHAVSE